MGLARGGRAGFTIVELLIVIVVIGVLAAITVVAYGNVQSKANDSRIRNAVSQLEKAIMTWSLQTSATAIPGGLNSVTAPSATGCVDGSVGWFASGTYTCTAEDHLVAQGAIPRGFTASLPKNPHYSSTNGIRSLMLYTCGSNKVSLYWTLYNPSAGDLASLDSTISTCSNAVGIRDSWGMKAGKIIQLN
jgi:prepilin-type N-terminal cleavage/methylation domain-containing protein